MTVETISYLLITMPPLSDTEEIPSANILRDTLEHIFWEVFGSRTLELL